MELIYTRHVHQGISGSFNPWHWEPVLKQLRPTWKRTLNLFLQVSGFSKIDPGCVPHLSPDQCDAVTKDELVFNALKALSTCTEAEKPLNADNTTLAIVGEDMDFTMYDGQEVAPFVSISHVGFS